MLTEPEKQVVQALALVWNQFLKLPVDHPDDTDEFRRAIHAAQEKVLARSGRREINSQG